jgi:hypothetical protein
MVVNTLSGIAEFPSGIAFAVGSHQVFRRSGSNYSALLERWNGFGWSLVRLPGALVGSALNAVTTAGKHDAWAVGSQANQTLIYHWNGRSWRRLSVQPRAELTAVTAISPDNVWASGALARFGNPVPVVLHWSGRQWRSLPTPPDPSGRSPGYEFRALSVYGSRQVWAGGAWDFSGRWAGYPLLEHWNGTRWSVGHFPQPRSSVIIAIDVVSPGDIWVAGEQVSFDVPLPPVGFLEHWNGGQWSRVSVPRQKPYSSFAALVNVPGVGIRLIGWTGHLASPHAPFWSVTHQPMIDKLSC